MSCKCKWDGALDGHLIRCKVHQEQYLAERETEKTGPDKIREAIKRDRGGEAPITVQGYA